MKVETYPKLELPERVRLMQIDMRFYERKAEENDDSLAGLGYYVAKYEAVKLALEELLEANEPFRGGSKMN